MEKKHKNTKAPKPTTKPRDFIDPKGGTLVVRNFSIKLKRDALTVLFSKCGRVKGVKLIEDQNNNMDMAFVYMLKMRDAQRAVKDFHNRVIDGRKLQVSIK